MGMATDLSTLLVNTFGGTLDGQLQALRDAREALLKATRTSRDREPLNLTDLRGQVDAVIDVSGPRLSRLDLDLKARGHLWIEGQDQDYALQAKPFIARIEGPIQGVKEFLSRTPPVQPAGPRGPRSSSASRCCGAQGRTNSAEDHRSALISSWLMRRSVTSRLLSSAGRCCLRTVV